MVSKDGAQEGQGHHVAYLLKVLEWKLTRGTFRPGLLQKAQLNSEEEVKRCFQAAYDLLAAPDADGSKAVKALTSLQGVGPVTASALLCRATPQRVAYMSDEAVLGSGLFKRAADIKYDMKTYTRFNQLVQAKALELGNRWTGDQVAKALWTHVKLQGVQSPASSKVVGKPAAQAVRKSIKKK
ncbi:unnamed protein product [Durusdinium trenchii]|uniref:HhH-GPD domain-containing protein n=1 Tax=Durusdinium trenchii TaxID=1381693 RepID=A0ABP0PXZ9_9DINO